MPDPDYQFLSDREQDYLDDPESFDQQARAEIRYRLRTKYAEAIDDILRLNDNPDLWDKKERIEGEYHIKCLNCGKRRTFPHYRYAESGQHVEEPPSGWTNVEFSISIGRGENETHNFRGTCMGCWETARNTPERAVEEGMIPCAAHGQHKITGKTDCEYIPFDESEIADLRERWEDRRHRACPDCQNPQSELTKGTYEVPDMGALSPDSSSDTVEVEGLVCGCGWKGPEDALSFVKA